MAARPRKSLDAISAGCFLCYFKQCSYSSHCMHQKKVDYKNLAERNAETIPRKLFSAAKKSLYNSAKIS